MTDSDGVTRGEFELLRQIVSANQTRLEAIDMTGTRGVGALTSRVDDLVKDMSDIKLEVMNEFRDHKQLHKDEESRRVAGKRWTVTTAIAMFVALAGLYPIIIVALHAT